MTERSNDQHSSTAGNVALWALQILTAAAFLMAGLGSLSGQPMMVETFDSNSLVFHGDDVLVTNLSLDVGAVTSPNLRTVDGPWAAAVKLHTVSKIKKRIPSVFK